MSRFGKMLTVALAALAAGASMAWSEMPQGENMHIMYVGTLKDVQGMDGRPPAEGSYIEIRTMYKAGSAGAAGWVAYPPEWMGIDEINPLKATSKVGCGVIPSARGRGLFAACVSGLGKNTQYVARVFSGPTPEESVAYCDSRPFVYTGDDTRAVTNVTFGVWKTMNGSTIDTMTDTDGDGLADSVEDLLALTDSDDPDTDGDGFSDGFEYTHSMDPLEPYQLAIALEIVSPTDESWQEMGVEADQSLYSLTWAAISGRTYRVEYQPSMKPENPEDAWKFISDTTPDATTDKYIFHLEDMEDAGMYDWIAGQSAGFFRVSYTNDASVSDEVPAGE